MKPKSLNDLLRRNSLFADCSICDKPSETLEFLILRFDSAGEVERNMLLDSMSIDEDNKLKLVNGEEIKCDFALLLGNKCLPIKCKQIFISDVCLKCNSPYGTNENLLFYRDDYISVPKFNYLAHDPNFLFQEEIDLIYENTYSNQPKVTKRDQSIHKFSRTWGKCENCGQTGYIQRFAKQEYSQLIELDRFQLKTLDPKTVLNKGYLETIDGNKIKVNSFLTFDGEVYAIGDSKIIGKADLCESCKKQFSLKEDVILTSKHQVILPNIDYPDIPIHTFLTDKTSYYSEKIVTENYTEKLQKYLKQDDNNLNPDLIKEFALLAVDDGMEELAYQAYQKLVKLFPNEIDFILPILSKLNKLKELDENYERLYKKKNVYITNNPLTLSNWAIINLLQDPQKSLSLSRLALKNIKKPKKAKYKVVFTNHLTIMLRLNIDEEIIQAFVEANDIEMNSMLEFNFGVYFLEHKQYHQALLHFSNAYSYDPAASNCLFLAKCYYNLEMYSLALRYINEIESNNFYGFYTDVDNSIKRTLETPNDKGLKIHYMFLKGKILSALNESSQGESLIKQALELNSHDPVLKDEEIGEIETIIGVYKSRNQIIYDNQIILSELTDTKEKLKTKINQNAKLSEFIDFICDLQSELSSYLKEIRNEIETEEMTFDYSNRIISLQRSIIRIRKNEKDSKVEELKNKYGNLNIEILECLCNSYLTKEILFKNFGKVEKIYAGVVLELVKAVEIALNKIVVKNIALHLNKFNLVDGISIITHNKKRRLFLFDYNKRVKHIMLGEIFNLLKNSDQEIKNALKVIFTTQSLWIIDELPSIILEIKDKYRNGYIHSEHASYDSVTSFYQFLQDIRFWDNINLTAQKIIK